MKRLGLILIGCLMMAGTVAAEPVDDAVAAAEKWLALVDMGQYQLSWSEAAAYFKGAVTEEQWVGSLQGIRTPLGSLVSRTRQTAEPVTKLPGAPDGNYVVIQFKTSFSNKSDTVETVTPMREADGSWRVAGYYIR